MAENNKEIELKIKTTLDNAATAKSLGEIKKSLKELKSTALEVGEGGAGFKQLTQQANELQDKLDDLKDSSKSLQGTGIEKLKSSFGLLTESFKNADFGKAKIAFQGLGSAMKAVPIFLIIEGIQYLVENFDKLSKGSGLLGKALRLVGDIIKAVTDGITWLLDKLGLVNAELDKQSEKLTKNAETSKAAIEKQSTAYDQLIALQKAQGKSTVETEKAKQEAIIKTNKALVEQAIAYVRAGGQLTEDQKKNLTEQLTNIKAAVAAEQVIVATAEKEKADKAKKAAEERKAKKKKEDDEYAAVLKAEQARLADIENAWIDKEEAKKKAAKEKAKADAIQALIDEAATLEILQKHSVASRLNTLKVNYELELAAAKDNVQKKLLIEAKYQEEKAKLEKEGAKASYDNFVKQSNQLGSYVQSFGSALNSIVGVFQAISDLQKQQADQDTKERQAKLDADISNLEDAKEIELAKEGLTAEQKAAINNKYAQQEYELKLEEYNRNTDLKKKAFEQDKKLKIAQTVIATITGAVAAFTGSLQSIPAPYGLIVGALSAAAVVAMGAIQIAALNKQKFDAGSPPQAPKASVATNNASDAAISQEAPSLKKIGRTQDEIANEANGSAKRTSNSNEPVRAYVVSQDVTTAQDKNAVIERRASF